MTEHATLRSPNTVASELDISSATLRRWSDEFTDFLSLGAGAGKGRGHRRYTDQDVATLTLIKDLMNNGLTYEQVRLRLNGGTGNGMSDAEIIHEPAGGELRPTSVERISDFIDEVDDPTDDRALVASASDQAPAITFLTNTLATLSDSQKSILNSQAANRELLGVLLQDNFNLKEENTRLRERILEVERGVAQNRQEEEWRREALRQELESKISMVSQLASEAVTTANNIETPQIKAIESRAGCLGTLFGRGGTKIVTVPPRRKAEGRSERAQPPDAATSFPAQPPASAAMSPEVNPAHPKPQFPPE